MIKIGVKGKILEGAWAPNGQILLEKSSESRIGAYYIYIWPNDGTKWSNTDTDMVYDEWLEDWECVTTYFKDSGWKIDWDNETTNSD